SLRIGEVENKLVRLEATQEKFATKSDIVTALNAAVAELTRKIDDVRTNIDGVKTELKKDIDDVRTNIDDVRTNIDGVKTELKKDIDGVRTELKKDIGGISTKFWAATGVLVAFLIALSTSFVWLNGAVNKSLGVHAALQALTVRDAPAMTSTPDRQPPAAPIETSSLTEPGNSPSVTIGSEGVKEL
ncbi:MAG: hypothetical protein LBR80_03065, partial [Deltaproteobacteria bacterium]|nr:hypothetical protein [Deltaproteobacteria bacterium]